MDYRIIVMSAGGNIIGKGRLADEDTFDLYTRMLGYRNHQALFDNSFYFIPDIEKGKDGFFRLRDVANVSVVEDAITVEVFKFYISPSDRAGVLDVYECVSEPPKVVETIALH
ncbi:hypothetical protein [Geomonas oryzae]|uniref:hypothetical protein n=1 Tax=Geomonas oryzae TaxID=2364273 RepID=UPI00100A8449|nr:hypothetical protein [Geomonas oryzae]